MRNLWQSLRKRLTQQQASVLVIVLWVAFGLVSIALYFGQSMIFNLQAADNYEAGIQADQAIEAAARYIPFVLTNLQQQAQTSSTNMPGLLITPGAIECYTPQSGSTPLIQACLDHEVPVGDAKFWLIGRDIGGASNVTSEVPVFGLVDEASKLNINTATPEMIEALPYMTAEAASSIINWRTNASAAVTGGAELEYGMLNPPYTCKNAPFETLDELKLVMNVTTDILYGADLNLNGVLDLNESTLNVNNQNTTQTGGNLDNGLNAGIMDYVTIYSSEPNIGPDGSARINLNSSSTSTGGGGGAGAGGGSSQLQTLLQNTFSAQRASQIMQQAGLSGGGGGGRGGGGGATTTPTFTSVLQFYVQSGMTADEFAQVADSLTTSSATTVPGLVNVNTAPAPVLACIPGIGSDNAQALVTYRQQHPDQLATVAWVTQALGQSAAIQAGPYITAKSYQFSADVAAVGHYGRGYRRTLFVFDISSGTPQIIYRRDRTQRNWALGNVRTRLQQTGNL